MKTIAIMGHGRSTLHSEMIMRIIESQVKLDSQIVLIEALYDLQLDPSLSGKLTRSVVPSHEKFLNYIEGISARPASCDHRYTSNMPLVFDQLINIKSKYLWNYTKPNRKHRTKHILNFYKKRNRQGHSYNPYY